MGYLDKAIFQGAREKNWDASIDEAREVQTRVSESLHSCEERLYEDLDDPAHQAERWLLTLGVTGTETHARNN